MAMMGSIAAQPNLRVFNQSTTAVMEKAVKEKSDTHFVVQHPSSLTEDALDFNLRNREVRCPSDNPLSLARCSLPAVRCVTPQVMDHVHNLRSKAANGLLVALRSALANGVPEVEMVTKSTTFQDIINIFFTFSRNTAIASRLEKAARVFCDEYGLTFGFWIESSCLDQLNGDRNRVVHCPVATSAAALTDDALIADVDFNGADAMVHALAMYAAKHGDELDTAAEWERWQKQCVKEELKQVRLKQGQGKR
jgi:hypothetical protein